MPELALPPPAARAFLSEGTALGVWRLRAAVHAGEGGPSGQWYRAEHALAADQASAVLVLPRSERAAGVMLRFGDQAGELGHLSHPLVNVPTDSGVTADGQPYLMLDWFEGQPIVRACADLPLRERLLIVVDLCEALRYLHQQGWLLGELDPSMLWVGAGNALKLMGLGLVRMPDPADPFERGTGLGAAPGYLSPEVQAGEPPSLCSEAYGLGALLWALVDGRLPSELGSGTQAGEVSLANSWPSLTALEQLSLDALLHKAAAPQVAQRHASAEALADDLRAWLVGANHSALALTPMPRRAAAPSSAALAKESKIASWPPVPPRRGWRLALTSIALATLAVSGWAGFKARLAEAQKPQRVAQMDTLPDAAAAASGALKSSRR